ncbi:universal stress protein [Salinilacihabitans rarus]|uniref:universal stress protein n=1 Tax=Salinilacihabitans rarus TaxID=2961596 RepID=UPI0020C8EFA8|nr:universal stress protein [Salinilacihabitans rarus]
MFDSVLVPTDGSEHAETAADTALDLAHEHDAVVHVVSVAETGPLSNLRLPGDAASAEEAIRGRAEEFVSRIADRSEAADLDVTTAVLSGPAGTAILDYADEVDADLIVMGTRGRGGIHRMAVGSVTDHVIRFGDVRVLVDTAE